MKKNIYKIFGFIAITFVLVCINPGNASASCKYNDYSSASTTLCNPLKQSDLMSFVVYAVKVLMSLIGVVAVVMIVVAGFQMVISQGDSKRVANAKSTIWWSVIGLVVAAFSFSLIAIIQNLLTSK